MTPAVTFRQYCAVFRKQAWIIAVVVVLSIGGGLYRLATRPPRYQAEASILVRPEGIASAGFRDSRLSAVQNAYREIVLNDVVHLLRSRTISERAAEQVGGLSAEELTRHVAVKTVPGTDFLFIRAADARPERAALIANAMAAELGGFYAQIYQAAAARARTFIEEQLRLAQDRLGAAEQAALEFQARTGAVPLPDDVSRTGQRILDLQAAYEAATLDETTAQTRVDAIRSHLRTQNDTQLASLSIATNPLIVQIRDHLAGLELQLADLRQVYTDQHPAVKVLLGKIAADRDRLSAEAARVLDDKSLAVSPAREQFVRGMIAAEVDAASARARAGGTRAILDKLQARLSNVSGNALALVRLQRDARDAEHLVAGLSALQKEAIMQESQAVASGQSAITVVDQAIPPSRPIAPPFAQTAGVAALLGLCLGAGLALALEALEKRMRATRRPEAASSAPELVRIPPVRARLGYRALAAASGIAIVLLPVLFAVLLLGVALITAGAVASALTTVHGAETGTVLSHLVQALAQVGGIVHGLYVAQVKDVPVHAAHVGQALMHALSAIQ